MRRSVALLFTVVVVGLTGCDPAEEKVDPYRPPLADAAEGDGKTLYARDCAWCHDDDGSGTDRGPALDSGTNGPALTHFVLSTGRMPLDDPQERSRHRDPVYEADEIAAIVEHVETFDPPGPEIPEIEEAVGATPEGLELYMEHCAACHAPTGVGAAITSSRKGSRFPSSIVAPSLDESSRLEVAEAIRTGPGTMPVFGSGLLDDEQVDAIVGYVDYLQDPSDRGGAPAGRVGPVVEGAIGWIIGMGALVVLIRWMGTRTGEE